MPQSDVVAETLNAQFAAGRPSSNLSDAGVVIRVFDECSEHARPWLTNEEPPCWDRLPVSVVRAEWPLIYTGRVPGGPFHVRAPGLVLSGAVQSRISCSYPSDTGTAHNWRQCWPRGGDGRDCIPGCHGFPSCRYQDNGDGRCWWPADDLETMLRRQDEHGHDCGGCDYNEIILDTFNKPWTDLFPSAVVAFFHQARCSQDEFRRVRAARVAFCSAFGMGPRCRPMLEFDELLTHGPFAGSESVRCVSCWDS